MTTRTDILNYLNQLLEPQLFKDYAPNGLQVEGKHEIQTIVTGVTASQGLLDRAVSAKADMVLVHHGYFWKGEDPCVVGIKYKRLKTLLTHNINLCAYHLPLDAHAVFGNNKQLADVLGFKSEGQLPLSDPQALVWHGELSEPMNGEVLAAHIALKLARAPLHVSGKAEKIKTIAWCTGAAEDYIDLAITHGVDAFLTGEVSERTVHIARETGIHFYAAGHHATERYGIQSLSDHLSTKFDLQCEFIDIDNPV